MKSPLLTEILELDHRRMKVLYEELKSETAKEEELDEEICFKTFRVLKAVIIAHSKAEEFALYSLFEHSKDERLNALEHFVLEGYEEHDLVEGILVVMGQAEEITAEWKAQLTVLSELLEHHINEEEKDFFPEVKNLLSQQQMIDLGEVYSRERDAILAKKSGLSIRPLQDSLVVRASPD